MTRRAPRAWLYKVFQAHEASPAFFAVMIPFRVFWEDPRVLSFEERGCVFSSPYVFLRGSAGLAPVDW